MIILSYFTMSLSSVNPTICFSLQNQLYIVFRIIFCLFCLFVRLFYLQISTLCSLINSYVKVIKPLCCNNGNTIQKNRHQKLILNLKKLIKNKHLPAGNFNHPAHTCMSQMYSNTQSVIQFNHGFLFSIQLLSIRILQVFNPRHFQALFWVHIP